ncbi:LOW QUALITY PROTEIN: disintegrin and metalloproteinase domain-containing protein 20-like [Rhinolophus ferrumequinum]|uniref:LOW QUALITY PROTEIN: disintegrin and metalloproteinase domain-containing protein 20-like n=1 Tax=Rhinolophus ferrumequinum TaxID=59479 RepID=UPI00140F9C7F|nr:LOW QUALITY PROTEIN: disintegrin and metalloproteinase domain-containing protein 20-like [Rhinolophus ferrumequinum]
MAAYGGSIMAVGVVLVHEKITLLLLWRGVFLFLPGWSQVGHSQGYSSPEVVIPMRHANSMKPPGWLSYRLHFGGQRHIVHMKVNKHLLSRHLPVFTYTDQGALVEDQPFVQNDCYYHGYVEGDPESLVAVSTYFGGFQGIIQTNDIVYEIEPERLSTTFEHLIYKTSSEETQFPPMRCGLTDEEIARQLKLRESVSYTLKQSAYESWWTHKMFLELAVVVDYNRYLHIKSNTSNVHNEVCLVVNYVNNLLQSLNIYVILMGIEIWTEGNSIPIDTIKGLLAGFCQWKKSGFNNRLPHDAANILVKKGYGIDLGLAYAGTICNIQYNCGVTSFMSDNLCDIAFIVSHEIGHILGMSHDGKKCECGHKTCIMFAKQSSTTKFSNCSYAQFMDTVAKQKCLYLSSNTENMFTLTVCGNGVVEEGEECDCGALHLCIKDPCWQSNCTLTPGAACAFGLCCKDCQITPSGNVRRKEENACDLPEWCNGISHHCPEDVYVQDGIPCLGGGYCYEKRCNNCEEQCKKIFGKEAKSANQSCYTKVNTRGDRFGHCGIHDSTYVRCNISDILCGRVQCDDVTEIPLLQDHSTVHWTHFNNVTCWGIDYHLGMAIPDIGEVKDGTQCGAEHICIQRKCVPMSLLVSDCSPETCNMKGVCNNRHHCHCNYEWDPPNCLQDGDGGSIDSGPPPRRKENALRKWTSYLLLLWFIFFFPLLCLLILSFMTGKRIAKEKEDVPTSPLE